jgi:hypothetical protein
LSIRVRSVRTSLSAWMQLAGERLGPMSRCGHSLSHEAKSAHISALAHLQAMFLRAITAPATTIPDAANDLVTDCTTTSAPCCSGRSSAGVATVESMISGTPRACAISATLAMSKTDCPGLLGNSP